MQIVINNPGVLSTIQDMGRLLHRSSGVPVSGAMDSLSVRMANMVVGNTFNDAVIEFTYATASFTATTAILIAYTDGGAVLKMGAVFLPTCRPVFIPAKQTITLSATLNGCRTYVAIAGGWDVPMVLGSRSTYLTGSFGGLEGRALQKGDVLNSVTSLSPLSERIYLSLQGSGVQFAKWSIIRQYFLPLNQKNIRITVGPERDWFEADAVADFLSKPFTIGRQSNRMGYQLEGCFLPKKKAEELLSTAVMPGTIQVTSKGEPIILMADCQTTGGYPRIAQVAAVDMPLCGQLQPGDVLSFTPISPTLAEQLYLEREQQLIGLADAIRTKYLL